MTTAQKQRPQRPYLDRTPEGVLFQVLKYVEAEDLARLSCAAPRFRLATERFATLLVKQKEWRLLDGATAAERLASEICYFDADAFRAVGRDAPRLRSARRRGSRARLRVAPPPGVARATRAANVPVAAFSEHGSLMKVQRPGRYRVAGVMEPSLKRRRLNEDEQRRERLAFQVKVAAVDERSSVYVGVATRRWARTRGTAQAIRSEECWLLDLRRGRFVHGFPAYDQAARAAHGARARYHATSDDCVVEGDVLGVRVVGGAAHFFRNGRRLAFSAGGRGLPAGPQPHHQIHDTGWGRPIPLSLDLVPIIEVHAREPEDAVSMAPLALQLGAWRPPPYCHGQNLRPQISPVIEEARRCATGVLPDVWRQVATDPALMDVVVPEPKPACTVSIFSVAFCSVLPLLPLVVGLGHTLLDVGGFALGVLCTHWRPAPLVWALGLLWRRAADAVALSLAVAAVWKTHFYDRRRPRRPRRGLRRILQYQMLKCAGVALAVALLPSAITLHRDAATLEVYLDARGLLGPHTRIVAGVTGSLTALKQGVVLTLARGLPFGRTLVLRWALRSGWRGAMQTCERWVLVEASAEGLLQLGRKVWNSKLAACLCSFPGGESARARRASYRAVAKLYAMMVLVPGSAAPLLYAAAEHVASGARPHWLVAVVAYPVLGAWAAFVAFVKFAFVVFALNTLAGFEDFDSPGLFG